MAVPKKRHTKSRRNNRRMHINLSKPNLVKCSKCGKETLSHAVCRNCGYYKGREVINVFAKLDGKEKKMKEREIKDVEGKKESLTMEELSKKK